MYVYINKKKRKTEELKLMENHNIFCFSLLQNAHFPDGYLWRFSTKRKLMKSLAPHFLFDPRENPSNTKCTKNMAET